MACPTGGGKTAILADIASKAVAKGNKVLFLVHRRNLVEQTKKAFERHGAGPVGIIMAGHEPNLHRPVQLATVQTYYRRLKLDGGMTDYNFPADLILIDEAHRSISPTYTKILDHYPKAKILGVTATPCRGDGRGLGEVYDDLVNVIDAKTLTDKGYLCKARYFVPTEPDLRKIKVRKGDYDIGELSEKMDTEKLVGDVVENWLKLAEGRKTIVFAVKCDHARHLAEAFEKQGIQSAVLTARSSDEERDWTFRQMQNGIIKVICNVALYQEGMDVPDISCVVMARPTKSLGLYRQCCGRGLRPAPGKEDLIVIDHAGVVAEHGLLTEQYDWTLDEKEKAWTEPKKKESKNMTHVCRACAQVFEKLPACPDCGTPLKAYGKAIKVVEAELIELQAPRRHTLERRRLHYAMILADDARRPEPKRGTRKGRVAIRYKNKYDDWPPPRWWYMVQPVEPTEQFLNEEKARFIKWIKSQNRRAA